MLTLKSLLTTSRVEALSVELQAARADLVQAEQAVGDCLVENLDITTATNAMKQTSDRVRVLEIAVANAIQKDEASQAALKQAERQVSIEAEAAACARVLSLGMKGEEIIAAVKQFAIDMAVATETLRQVGGNEKYAYSMNEIRGQFGLFLGLAKHPLTNNGHVSAAFMKYNTWTECLKKVCGRPQP